MRREWTDAKRLVVKIGSSLLVEGATGKLKADWLASLSDDIAASEKRRAGRHRRLLRRHRARPECARICPRVP